MVRLEDFDFSKIIGKKLCSVYVHYVSPEINIVFLELEDSTFVEIAGLVGSELLGIKIISFEQYLKIKDELVTFEALSVFFRRILKSIHLIGNEWNGHGIELTFSELFDKSLIIQSIYAGDKDSNFEDCLRVGIVDYTYTFENRICLEKIREVINQWDPISLFPLAPKDEYEVEIEEIYQISKPGIKPLELANIIQKVFIKSFNNSFNSDDLECLIIANKIISL